MMALSIINLRWKEFEKLRATFRRVLNFWTQLSATE